MKSLTKNNEQNNKSRSLAEIFRESRIRSDERRKMREHTESEKRSWASRSTKSLVNEASQLRQTIARTSKDRRLKEETRETRMANQKGKLVKIGEVLYLRDPERYLPFLTTPNLVGFPTEESKDRHSSLHKTHCFNSNSRCPPMIFVQAWLPASVSIPLSSS